jgi:hypothetical protein
MGGPENRPVVATERRSLAPASRTARTTPASLDRTRGDRLSVARTLAGVQPAVRPVVACRRSATRELRMNRVPATSADVLTSPGCPRARTLPPATAHVASAVACTGDGPASSPCTYPHAGPGTATSSLRSPASEPCPQPPDRPNDNPSETRHASRRAAERRDTRAHIATDEAPPRPLSRRTVDSG